MKDTNKQNDKVIMSREHQALIKFKKLPNLNDDGDITTQDWYNPTLYKYNGNWVVDWVHICDENDSILTFGDCDICNAINKAYDWYHNKLCGIISNEIFVNQ